MFATLEACDLREHQIVPRVGLGGSPELRHWASIKQTLIQRLAFTRNRSCFLMKIKCPLATIYFKAHDCAKYEIDSSMTKGSA